MPVYTPDSTPPTAQQLEREAAEQTRQRAQAALRRQAWQQGPEGQRVLEKLYGPGANGHDTVRGTVAKALESSPAHRAAARVEVAVNRLEDAKAEYLDAREELRLAREELRDLTRPMPVPTPRHDIEARR